MKLLFVENHSIFAAQVTYSFLSPYQVTVVPSLASARTSLANSAYDVLLIDYDLDDGKGDELVSELRSAGSKLRIIGVSAREDGNAALFNAGADAICSKMDFNRIQWLI